MAATRPIDVATPSAGRARQGGAPGGESPRVLVVEDHQSVAIGLVSVLRSEGMAAEATAGPTAAAVLRNAAEFAPSVVLLDLDLGPVMGSALPLIEHLMDLDAAVVMLTGVRDRRALGECVEAGARDVVDKAAPIERVLEAVTAAASGEGMSGDRRFEWMADLRAARAEERRDLAPFERLTPREQDVLIALADGLSAAEIAAAGFVSVFTVRGHIRSILTKLGVSSQLAAVARARRAGWLPD